MDASRLLEVTQKSIPEFVSIIRCSSSGVVSPFSPSPPPGPSPPSSRPGEPPGTWRRGSRTGWPSRGPWRTPPDPSGSPAPSGPPPEGGGPWSADSRCQGGASASNWERYAWMLARPNAPALGTRAYRAVWLPCQILGGSGWGGVFVDILSSQA